ncbi:hypothetical protein ABEB36_007209 [Hypothenemus hampei]|uniref:NAD(P)-binding domain-containing protein n=1 Tax=Hypothenemus hampei TaxID=57062 RepID=A0ABD1ET70_HYPHA
MTKLAIFGSTGMTGLCTVEAAIKKGFQLKALVRDPSKFPENYKKDVEIIKGNILNYDDVLNTIQDTNGVVITLGTRNDLSATTELSEGLKNIVKAMKEANVDTISVCLSAFLFKDFPNVPAMFHDLTAEHQRMYDILKGSNLNFIAVFPPHIANQPASSYQIELDKYIGRAVSKYDLGQFLIDALNQPETYGHTVGIISK